MSLPAGETRAAEQFGHFTLKRGRPSAVAAGALVRGTLVGGTLGIRCCRIICFWSRNCFSAALAVRSFFELALTPAAPDRPPVPRNNALRMNPIASPASHSAPARSRTAQPLGSGGTATYHRGVPRHPPELDDPEWLRKRYELVGDRAIADELCVHRDTVRAARRRYQISPRPRGRQSGTSREAQRAQERSAAETIAERIQREVSSTKAGAGPGVVAARIRAIQQAQAAGDALALEDAIAGAASALGVWLEQLLRSRCEAVFP